VSHEWSLRCKTDGTVSETEINNGEHILRSIVAAYPLIKAAREAVVKPWLEVSILGDSCDLIGFLDEYGKREPLEAKEQSGERL